MARHSLYAVAAALVLAACSEPQPESTTGPQFAGGNTDPCGFSNSLITGYFPSSRQSPILSLKQSMANAGTGTEDARDFGFQIMDSIGSVSRNFAVSPAAGAQLTVAVIGCMFDNATFTYPTNAVSDFTAALTSVTGGAYFVRGGGREGTVIGSTSGVSVGGNLSGIAPSSDTWTTMLSGNTVSEGRALIYGYPVTTDPLLFEWASVPSDLAFSPEAVVSVCDNDVSATAMVHEEDIGVLAYVNSSICSTPQTMTMIDPGWGPKALATRLSRVLVSALSPTPLQATALATGTGGKTSTIPKSQFGKQSVSTLTVDWLDAAHTPPTPTINGTSSGAGLGTTFAVAVKVSASDTPVFGTCVYLTGSNNNGTPTKLTTTLTTAKHPSCTNPPGGDANALSVLTTTYTATASQADFGDVGVTKTGGIAIKATADVIDRAGLGSVFIKSNVKPCK
jgi:hypothetical protein